MYTGNYENRISQSEDEAGAAPAIGRGCRARSAPSASSLMRIALERFLDEEFEDEKKVA